MLLVRTLLLLAIFVAGPSLIYSQDSRLKTKGDGGSLQQIEQELDTQQAKLEKKIDETETRRILHNKKERPAPRTKAAEDFDREAAEGKAEGEKLDKELEALAEQRRRLPLKEVRWARASQPSSRAQEVVRLAINDHRWPLAVRQTLAKISFRWESQPLSGLELLNPKLTIPAAYDPKTGALVIRRGFTECKLATQLDILAFELGKKTWDHLSKDQKDRFSDEFAGKIRSSSAAQLPYAKDVVEADDNATFSYAYRHFLFERKKLPDDLILWWLHNPPHLNNVP